MILQKSLKILLPRTIWLRPKHESAENELDCRTEKLLRDKRDKRKTPLAWAGGLYRTSFRRGKEGKTLNVMRIMLGGTCEVKFKFLILRINKL